MRTCNIPNFFFKSFGFRNHSTISHSLKETNGCKNNIIPTTDPQITKKSRVLESDIVLFRKPPVIQQAMKYPITVPTVLVMMSLMSVVRKIKICDISIRHVARNPVKAACLMSRNLPHKIGRKKPNGINRSTFRQVFVKSSAIPALSSKKPMLRYANYSLVSVPAKSSRDAFLFFTSSKVHFATALISFGSSE